MLTVGLALTVAASLATAAAHRHAEEQLLTTQTQQAAALISATVVSLSAPLSSAAELAAPAQDRGTEFATYMSQYVGPKGLFVHASLWQLGSATPLASIGVPSKLTGARLKKQLSAAAGATTFIVKQVDDPATRIAYAQAAKRDPRLLVFAERAIDPDRQVPVVRGSGFAGLQFATYLGPVPSAATLATTNVDPATLPLKGPTATEQIPFGNTVITLVARADGDLGGGLGPQLPWIALAVGGAATAASALMTQRLAFARRRAEDASAAAQSLNRQLDAAYEQQRTIATTLQGALLPDGECASPGVDLSCRYIAGAVGVDIGGDWYCTVPLEGRRFAFAVGDVSGRGVRAAAVMARLQFTMRAFLAEGVAPHDVLTRCARHIDLERDGHFATALVGTFDAATGSLTLASAGHPAPLLATQTDVEPRIGYAVSYVQVTPGLPLGIGDDEYVPTTLQLSAGAMLLAYTDGLVERRDESIDDGLARLAAAATVFAPTTDAWVDQIIARIVPPGAADDIAVLAFRADGSS